MRKFTQTLLAVTASFLIMIPGLVQAQPTPSFEIVANLGATVTPSAVNNDGTVVGAYYHSGSGQWHAFYKPLGGSLVDIGTLGGSWSQANDINDAGVIVGDSYVATSGYNHPFIYQGGSMSSLIGSSGNDLWIPGYAKAISSAGVVVGRRGVSIWDTTLRPTKWVSGSATNLSTHAGLPTTSAPNAVNANGTITGDWGSDNKGWLVNGTTTTNLGSLGGSQSFANAINLQGEVVGNSLTTGDTYSQAFLWRPIVPYGITGAMVNLGCLGTGTRSVAVAINAWSEIIGDSTTSGNNGGAGFYWRNGIMYKLTDYISNPSGWSNIQTPTDISDSGYIVTRGVYGGSWHGILLKRTN